MRSKVRPNGKVYTVSEIADIVAPIADDMGVERIYLFGSYARGCATPDSDVDLLVECGRIDSYFGIGKLYSRLNRALEKDLDIVPSDADQEFIDRIRPELVLVYGQRSRRPRGHAGCGRAHTVRDRALCTDPYAIPTPLFGKKAFVRVE